MQPELIALMALTIQPGGIPAKEVAAGDFILPTALQILEKEQCPQETLDF